MCRCTINSTLFIFQKIWRVILVIHLSKNPDLFLGVFAVGTRSEFESLRTLFHLKGNVAKKTAPDEDLRI